MELNRKNMKRYMLLITFAMLLYWGLHNAGQFAGVIRALFKLLSPFIIGLCLAFVLNLLLCPLERAWNDIWGDSKSAAKVKLKRPVCLVLALLIFLGIISALFFVLIPQISATASTISTKVPDAIMKTELWWGNITTFFAEHNVVLPSFDLEPETIIKTVSDFIAQQGEQVFGKTMDITISIFSALINLILALVFSLYVLAQKERLGKNAKKLMYASMKQKTADRALELLSLTGNTFSRFVSGQVTEAFILATLCFIGMSILRMPYALVVSFVIGFTSLVPIFGAWVGAIVGAFLIVFVSPIKALGFVVFLLILQQIEGNVIYPKVVGKSVGLPGIWVLAAVTIGGGIFGVTGMLFGVPIFSIIYTLMGEFVRARYDKIPETVLDTPPEDTQEQ